MKKLLMIVILLSLVSCTPLIKSDVINTSALTAVIEPSAASTTLPKATITAKPSATTTSPEVTATQLPACPTAIKLSAIPTLLPEATATQPVFNVVLKEYNPSEWKILYDKNSVMHIEIGFKDQIWAKIWKQVGYYNGKTWILYSEKDFGLPNITDMAVAPDGTVWLAGRYAISRFRNGHWNVFPIPNAPKISSPHLAIDSSNLVWLALSYFDNENNLRIFDGTKWDKQQRQVNTDQLLFNLDGTLWAPLDGTIGQYNGKTWKKYSGLWTSPKTESGHFQIRIASDSQGNIFGIADMQEWVLKISNDGSMSNIPFDFVHFELNPFFMSLFVDKRGRIWTNACLKDSKQDCLAFYQDNQWISFRNFPFGTMTDMNELSDGTLLVSSTQGLFQYKTEN